MDAHEVVPDGVERDHVHVVLELLRERIRQPGEPPHLHPHGQVLALGVAGRDVLRARVARDRRLTRPDALAGAVAPLSRAGRAFGRGRRGAIELHQHGVVDIVAEGVLDGFQVWAVAIAGELHAGRQPRAQVVHERRGVLAVPAADHETISFDSASRATHASLGGPPGTAKGVRRFGS